MPLLPIRDVSLFVDIVGSGYPLALMHGGPGADHWTLEPLRPLRDPKTILQEWAQARGIPTPAYRELARTGPHHDPEFRVAVVLPDRPPAEGIGSSKRAAEQAAAAVMLTRVGVPADELDG